MRGLTAFVEHFFWAMVWVFLLIIVGLAILHWVSNVNNGGFFGNFSNWVTGAATP